MQQSGSYGLMRARVATTTAITVIQLATPADCVVDITRASGSQSSSTTSAASALALIRKSAAATVTSQTPQPTTQGMQASKCVGGASASGITASAEGTDSGVPFWEEGLNIVGSGALYLPVPEERLAMGPSEFLGLKHFVAPAGNWSHGLMWNEFAF